MKLITYTAELVGKDVALCCSEDEPYLTSNWSDLITYLMTPCDMALVFNLDKFVETISSLFPEKERKELHNGDKARVYLPDGEKVFYIPARMFSIGFAGKEVNIYGLSRYAEKEPASVKELLELGNRVILAYKEFGIVPTQLKSPVSVYSEYLDKLRFSRTHDLPSSALGLVNKASEIMLREWREVHKLGNWNLGEASDCDLNAGYPSLIAHLPDISHARFFEADMMPIDYSWGIVMGDLEVMRKVSPFQDDNGIHRIGILKDYTLTTDGLWLINKWGGSFTFKHGWFYKLPKVFSYPFATTMTNLYKKRESPNELVGRIAKGISVGIYGMLAQRYLQKDNSWKLGNNFNSIYACLVTSRCSLRVADIIYRLNLSDSVINIAVDGFLTEGIPNIQSTREMGKWRVNEPSSALVVSQLNAWHNGKHPNGKTYDEMVKAITDKPKSSIYYDIDFNLLEYNRNFFKRPHNGSDLITNKYISEPIK